MDKSVAIIGAGAAGLCLGIGLKKAGFSRFTIYEKSGRVGGTWNDNTYPGTGCDVPSHLYCFSFAPNPHWSRRYPLQPEIQSYLETCAARYGLGPHIRFRTEIASARFDSAAAGWRLKMTSGEESFANVLVSATGQLNRPHTPAIPGLEQFGGSWFHSARWNHDLPLAGRRIAVIGNGASAIQFIPHIAPVAERLTLFQRSANWILPRHDRPYTAVEKWIFRRVPLALRLFRHLLYLRKEATFFGFYRGSWLGGQIQKQARRYLKSQITDPELCAILTPDYPAGCKRILISDDYYQALVRPNVEIVTSPIEHVERDGIVTAEGTRHTADVIVFATGFQTSAFLAPMRIENAEGVTLNQAWRDGAEAYLGVAVSGFPNLFLLYGPNTNLGHNSILFMIECQVNYVLRCLQHMGRAKLRWLDVRREAMTRFNDKLQEQLLRTTWVAGCSNWYRTESGKIVNNWPGFTLEYWWRTRRPNFTHFIGQA